MTAEQVIKAREQVEALNIFEVHPFQIIGLMLATIGIFVVHHYLTKWIDAAEDKGRKSKAFYLLPLLPIGLITILIWVILLVLSVTHKLDKGYQEWEEGYLKPYVETLETRRISVERVNYVDEMTTTIAYFEGDKLIRKKDVFKIKVAPEGEKTPYLVYKVLEHDLSPDYKAGMVDAVLYIPKQYEEEKVIK